MWLILGNSTPNVTRKLHFEGAIFLNSQPAIVKTRIKEHLEKYILLTSVIFVGHIIGFLNKLLNSMSKTL